MDNANKPAIMKRSELVRVTNKRLSTRSTIKPIGIAKSNHGSITIALSIEIRTGSLVSDIASNGAAVAKIPSARLLIALAPKRRLKPGPSLSVFNLSTHWIPAARNHLLGFIWSPCAFKVWMHSGWRFQNVVKNFPRVQHSINASKSEVIAQHGSP